MSSFRPIKKSALTSRFLASIRNVSILGVRSPERYPEMADLVRKDVAASSSMEHSLNCMAIFKRSEKAGNFSVGILICWVPCFRLLMSLF